MKKEKYPEGHFLSYGLAIGLPIGVAIGVAIGNIAIGPAIGVGIGFIYGSILEKKAKREGRVRNLTKREKRIKKRNLLILLGLGLLGLVSGIVAYLILQ